MFAKVNHKNVATYPTATNLISSEEYPDQN